MKIFSFKIISIYEVSRNICLPCEYKRRFKITTIYIYLKYFISTLLSHSIYKVKNVCRGTNVTHVNNGSRTNSVLYNIFLQCNLKTFKDPDGGKGYTCK